MILKICLIFRKDFMSSNLNLKKILSYLIFLAPISFIVGAAIVELIFTFYLIFLFNLQRKNNFF